MEEAREGGMVGGGEDGTEIGEGGRGVKGM